MSHKLPKKGLKIAHINICSIRNKLTEVADVLLLNNLHILAVSETHLDSTFEDTSLMIHGYNIFRKDRNAHGGGVAFYIQNHIPVKVRQDLMSSDIEVLWLQVCLKHLKPILIGCCYRPPSANSWYLDKICEMLDHASSTSHEIYFMGDLNIDWNSFCCPMKMKLMNASAACGLSQVINKPTRICLKTDGTRVATCIDHIFINTPEFCSNSISVPIGCSDHNLIAIVRKTKVPKPGPKVLRKRSFQRFNQARYEEDVKNANWSKVFLEKDPDEALQAFNGILMTIVDYHVPLKKFTVKNVNTPWLDKELKEHMRERDQVKLTAISSSLKSDWQIYCKLRNFVTKSNKKKKKLYYENRINEIKHDSKQLWNTLNYLLRGNTKSTPSYLEVGGEFFTKPKDIANHLNSYFITKIDKLKSTVLPNNTDLSYTLIDHIMEGKQCSFEFKKVSVAKVELMLMTCKDKPPGVDDLDSKLLRPIAPLIAPMVTHIINLCFNENVCPQAWKISKVVPIPKNKKLPFSESNSRPISLLPILSKIMERIVYEQMQSYFSNNNLITNFQHAYREKYSTATALTQMVDDWFKEIEERKIIGVILLDFSAAFDIMDHELMLKKFKSYGFSQSALLWINSYLSDRRQMVYFNGSYSDVKHVKHGVPQGSCLGPLLYTIFTNDLPLVLQKASISMYADDSTIYLAEAKISDLNINLDRELKLVLDWINSNKLILNVSKTTSVVIGTNYSLCLKPKLDLSISNMLIKQVEETKLLGVIIESKLSWDKHIQRVVTKMGNTLSVIKRCAKYLTKQTIKQVIQALVLSHLDYCSTVWSNTSLGNIRKLQLVQNKAARVALSCGWRTNVIKMHECLSWFEVKNRLLYSLMVFIKNVIRAKTPFIFYQKLSFSTDAHNYSTRHATAGCFALPRSKTKSGQRTTSYRAMQEWNTLPNHITQQNDIYGFKKILKEHYLKRNFIN